jgi:hypothetical protein
MTRCLLGALRVGRPRIEFTFAIGGTADIDGVTASADRDVNDPERHFAARLRCNAARLHQTALVSASLAATPSKLLPQT